MFHGALLLTTPPPLAADADLAKRVIESKGSKVAKHIVMLLSVSVFVILITFGHIPRLQNRQFYFRVLYNDGTVESVSMFTRFVGTPVLFLCKFIVKSIVYKGRTIIIKMPLVRNVMPKRELRGFLRKREEDRSRRLSSLRKSRSRRRSSLRAASSRSSKGRAESESEPSTSEVSGSVRVAVALELALR